MSTYIFLPLKSGTVYDFFHPAILFVGINIDVSSWKICQINKKYAT